MQNPEAAFVDVLLSRIKPPPKQREMLNFLIEPERINKWVEKTDLYIHLYDSSEDDFRPNPKILDVYLNKLRNQIAEALAEEGVILTIERHHLVSDYRGRIGFYTEPQDSLRGKIRGTPRGTGRALQDLARPRPIAA